MKSSNFASFAVASFLILLSTISFAEPLAELNAVWHTKSYLPEENWNLDSLAYWADGDGGGLLFASAKEGNSILVLDPYTGELIATWGSAGSDAGQFSRPNGLLVWRNYLFVVERDNRRVQVLELPSGKSLATFGDDILIKPYGICAVDIYPPDLMAEDGVTQVEAVGLFVTDDYQPDTTMDVDNIPLEALRGMAGARVKVFSFAALRDTEGALKETRAEVGSSRWFGDTVGQGVLYAVESLVFDIPNGQEILICDERTDNVKVYGRLGTTAGYVEQVAFRRLLHTPKPMTGDPEGIALWDVAANGTGTISGNGSGYVVLAEQEKTLTTFHLWERGNLNPYVGSFLARLRPPGSPVEDQGIVPIPEYLANTDGICLVSGDVGIGTDGEPVFNGGVLFAIHDDSSVAAFALGDLAAQLRESNRAEEPAE